MAANIFISFKSPTCKSVHEENISKLVVYSCLAFLIRTEYLSLPCYFGIKDGVSHLSCRLSSKRDKPHIRPHTIV